MATSDEQRIRFLEKLSRYFGAIAVLACGAAAIVSWPLNNWFADSLDALRSAFWLLSLALLATVMTIGSVGQVISAQLRHYAQERSPNPMEHKGP